ncbi:MAG: hypothetical protein JWN59_334 [Sphingomonas bacterium]|nr:hypothetical protein [Sphingomonas bacterium]
MTIEIAANVKHPSAWRASEIGGKEGLTHRLGRDHVAAIEALLAATRDIPVCEIGRDSFRDPALDDLMAAARDAVMHGHGAIILSGLDLSGRSIEDFERIYWYLGTHLGTAVIQSGKGDLIGHVRHVSDSTARGYLSDMELGPHTDYHEILSLASFRKASRGGQSGLSSAITVHNEMRRSHPDLLRALYEGYPSGLPARYGVNEDASDRNVPVYSVMDGEISAFTLSFYHDAARQRGEALPPKLIEAFGALRDIASREDIQARFMLEPGEMMFWHNRINFHSRTRFENDPGVERLLLRLWIEVPDGRPVHPQVAASCEMIGRYHALGLDQRASAAA